MHFIILVLLHAVPVSGVSNIPDTCEVTAARLDLPADGGPLQLSGTSRNGDIWVEVEEHGQSLKLDGGARVEVLGADVPLRHGWFLAAMPDATVLTIRRVVPMRSSGHVLIRRLCATDALATERIEWLREAQPLVAKLQGGSTDLSIDGALAKCDVLEKKAPRTADAALAAHLRAQLLLLDGRHTDASAAFQRAEHAWLELQSPSRALASRVGRAESELMSAHIMNALHAVRISATLRGKDRYLEARLENTRCQVLYELASFQAAADCYSGTLKRLEKLGERVEYVNTLQNSATVERELGNQRRAIERYEEAASIAIGPSASLVRGRAHLALADVSLSRGMIPDALSYLQLASDEFAVAKAPRSVANTLLKAADLYGQLGSFAEAYASIANALPALSPRDASARVARAALTLSTIDRNNRRDLTAWLWARLAKMLYMRLAMPESVELAEIAEGHASLGIGRAYANQRYVVATRSSSNIQQASLLNAEVALRQGDTSAAGKFIDEVKSSRMSLADQLRFARSQSEFLDSQFQTSSALRVLEIARERVIDFTRATERGLLRFLMARETLSLRRDAFRLLLHIRARDGTPDVTEHLWEWLVSGAGSSTTSKGSFHARRADAEIAASLMSAKPDATSPVFGRELLSLLVDDGGAYGDRAIQTHPDLRVFQHSLPPETLVLARIDGGEEAALMLISNTAVRVVAGPSTDELAAPISILRDALRSRTATSGAITVAADRVSRTLLGALIGQPQPSRLLIVADGLTETIPWPLIPWPGHSSPLVFASTAEVVVPSAENFEREAGDSKSLDIVAMSHGNGRQPELAGMASEVLSIGKAISGHAAIRRITTREEIMDALSRVGGWTHIAGHGFAKPSLLGHAGLWLDPVAPSSAPEFLGWLDILDRGVGADLVVLNACELGDSGDAIVGNPSFASAVSHAGAKQVVAAMWPVSDGASAVWVPAFYRTLIADPEHDAAPALRAAELELRSTRMFRDPFYWAGLQTYTRLVIPSSLRPAARPLESESVGVAQPSQMERAR